VLRAFLFEFSLLGLATGVIAAGVGALAAWAVVHHLMNIPGVSTVFWLSKLSPPASP